MSDLFTSLIVSGWPWAIALIVIVFLFLFRSQIGNLISRISSLTKEGIKAELPPEVQNEEKQKLAVEDLMNLGRSITRDETEKIIFADLKGRKLDTEGDTIRVLVRHLAATQIALDFLQIYNAIFGGQIFILKRLHQVAGVGLFEKDVDAIYMTRKAAAHGVLDEWDMQRYLLYLHNNILIRKTDGRLHITNKGQDFLVWLTQSGVTENKGL